MGNSNLRDDLKLESANTTNNEPSRVLSGWKEIAGYLGRGVRTVQRWEKLGLPVRRPNAHLRSAVLTTTSEIDLWMRGCGNGRSDGRSLFHGEDARFEALCAMVEQLRAENDELRREVDALKRSLPAPQNGRGASAHIAGGKSAPGNAA
jgi:hypothetical protein